MRNRTLFASALVATLVAAQLSTSPPARASNEIAEATALQCAVCHDRPGSKLLTDRGKYYESQRTLSGFDEVSAVFGACTSCHVRKPGSARLTADGRRFGRLMISMHGVREFAAAQHQWTADASAELEAEAGEPTDDGEADSEAELEADPEVEPAPEADPRR